MKPKTEELLYLLLWSCEMLSRPTWRSFTESFEGWAYRNGFQRQLARLEKLQLVEHKDRSSDERVHRLTEAGRLWALGGRDLESCWQRPWDGRWRLVLFDVPLGEDSARNKLRAYLRSRGFGYLQNSVWVTPDPFTNERQILAGSVINVESLVLLEAKPCAGESDAEIVAGAWDFEVINRRYMKHLDVLRQRPRGHLESDAAAKSFKRWARHEREAWYEVMWRDPLLPACLLPPGYLGRKSWHERCIHLAQAAEQIQAFKSGAKA